MNPQAYSLTAKAHPNILRQEQKKSSFQPQQKTQTQPFVLGVNDETYDPETDNISQQRQLHHQRPRTNQQSPPRQLWLRKSLHDNMPQLHQRPKSPRPRPQRPQTRTRSSNQHYPNKHRRSKSNRRSSAKLRRKNERLCPCVFQHQTYPSLT